MKRLLVVMFLCVTLLLLVRSAPSVAAPSALARQRIASNLGLLLALEEANTRVAPETTVGRQLARIRAAGAVEVSAAFVHELSPAERAQIERLGVEFQRVAGELAHLDRFYGLLVPVGAVETLAAHPLVEWLEATWRPVDPPPLDVSIPAVNAPAAWQVGVRTGGFTTTPLTGRGVTIANFDTGVDVLHPTFLDGTDNMLPDECNWDSSGNGVFDPNVDHFPLTTAVLRYWNAVGDPNNTAGLDLRQDWIFQDDDGDSVYDLNEPIFMANDTNGNGVLEAPSECLRSRGNLSAGIPTSKIAATLGYDSVERVRGTDLEQTAADPWGGHGTSVSGILVGGNALFCSPGWLSCNQVYPNTRRYTGIAPNADLLVADRYTNTYTSYIPWATGRGADVMLYEYGSWVYEYLDGSSNHEQMMDAASAAGIVQVVPTGNLHCGGYSGCNPRHLQYVLPANSTFTHQFNLPSVGAREIYASMTWLNPTNNLTVALTLPGSATATPLPCATAASGWLSVTVGSHNLWCERAANSSRGTALYNIWIENNGALLMTGNWTMDVGNSCVSAETTNFYIADDIMGWAFGAGWLNAGSGVEKHTAAFPSTCDSCIGVASYSTRSAPVGALSWFSGRGPRFIDGARIVDVAAPGEYDVIAPDNSATSGSLGSYDNNFGGTSAAAPHVAGAAALLVQFTQADVPAAEIEAAIQRGAVSDGYTGMTPNDNWGYGKLDVYGALEGIMHDLGDAPDSSNHYNMTMSAYPNLISTNPALFPTVFTATVPAGAPGPIHWRAGSLGTGPADVCLGAYVSAEAEADQWYDQDLGWNWGAAHNIDPLTDSKNGEGGAMATSDDGLSYPGVMPHCSYFNLNYQLTLAPGATSPHYVNVWADWNRDGDWGDVFTCTVAGDAPEWAVQNQVISAATYPAPGTYSISTPAFLPYHPLYNEDPLWIRISVSEQPAPIDPATGRADGRGPAGGYEVGETEDYYLWYPPAPSFQVTPAPNCLGSTVVFTNTSTGSRPLTYTWDFGDGTFLTTTARTTHTHQYSLPGGYPVLLTITDISGMPGPSAFAHVQVDPVPVASFTTNVPVLVSETVTFTNSTVDGLLYTWDFGDGVGTSTEVSPTYVYTQVGGYTVTLTADSGGGCIDVYTDMVWALVRAAFLPVVLRTP
jgi:PKD repeat protein